ncbi:hypothetical protein ATW7_06678 [Alteromonadales bacterium TW-7]|nr:hypothetical protein ATW7_06678 [Alteromonadales bacterium TW-7]
MILKETALSGFFMPAIYNLRNKKAA